MMTTTTERFRCLTIPATGPLIPASMKPMHKLWLPVAFATVLVLAPALRGQTNRLNGVAAIVNDAIITEQEVYSILEKELPRTRDADRAAVGAGRLQGRGFQHPGDAD
jgi:hypothetical protein